MKKTVLIFILTGLGLSVSSVGFCATLNSLSQAQFVNAFVNKTASSIGTDNLNGQTINNTFSMFLDDQGHIVGKMAIKPANEPQTDTGVYSVDSDGTAYITWQHWDGAKKLCFHVFDTQNTYISVGCDHIFHTAFMKDMIRPGNHLK